MWETVIMSYLYNKLKYVAIIVRYRKGSLVYFILYN